MWSSLNKFIESFRMFASSADHYFYVTYKRERIKINVVCNSWLEVLNGVPQGSIFGRLLFNIC